MTGLSQFQKKVGTSTVKPFWFSIKNGETKQVTILAEPQDFRFIVEHTSPEDWKRRAVCTYDEHSDPVGCYACEQRLYGWNQRLRVYIPVLVGKRPYVIAQGVGATSVLHSLVQHKRERGIIRDVVYDVSRKGEGRKSAYRAEPTDTPAPLYKAKVDIDSLINNIEYTKQQTYYKE